MRRVLPGSWVLLAALGPSACSVYSEDMDKTGRTVLPSDRSDDGASSDDAESAGDTSKPAMDSSSKPPGSAPSAAPTSPGGSTPSNGGTSPAASDDSDQASETSTSSGASDPSSTPDAGSPDPDTTSSATSGSSASSDTNGSDTDTTTIPPPVEQKPDYVIDDFEDTDPALPRIAGRVGYWFTEGSSEGTITPIDDVFVKPEDSGALYVAHVVASGFESHGSWAAFGVNLNDGDAYAEGADYVGLKFYARAGGADTTVRVEVRTTENDLPLGDAGATLNDDTYGRVVEVGSEWKLYYVQWADATFEQQGWGESFDFEPANMTSISFKLAPQESGFDLWLDDIEFIQAP